MEPIDPSMDAGPQAATTELPGAAVPPPATPPPATPPSATPPSATPAAGGGRSTVVVVTVALIALVVGVMAGYAASVPKQNDLTDQRDAAQAQLATMTTARDDLQAQKDQLQKDLDKAKSATGVAQDARDICSKAAEDGSALIARYDNLLGEVFTMFDQASEGYYNAQLGDHISQQSGEMVTESNTVEKELSDCEDSVKA